MQTNLLRPAYRPLMVRLLTTRGSVRERDQSRGPEAVPCPGL